LFAVAAALGGAALLAQTGAFGAPAHASGATGVTVSASTGSSAVVNLGAAGWKVLTSATATQGGAQISTPGFSTGGWLTVVNDGAGAPGTEVGALLQNGACPNVFFSTNMKTHFGQMTRVGADTIPQFSVPWWPRRLLHAGPTTRPSSRTPGPAT
jgi:exo-1,4-beta-D-glucosaminidase